jgi:hypothetical protein
VRESGIYPPDTLLDIRFEDFFPYPLHRAVWTGLLFHSFPIISGFQAKVEIRATKKPDLHYKMAVRLSQEPSERKTVNEKTRDVPSQSHDWFGFLILSCMLSKKKLVT